MQRKKIRKIALASSIMAAILLVSISLALVNIGTIIFPWQVVEQKATMNPDTIQLSIGNLTYNEEKTVTPSSYAELTVYIETTMSATLAGSHAGLATLNVTVQLRQGTSIIASANVSKITTTAAFTPGPISPGLYDVYVGYTVKAGSTTTSGTASVTIDY